MSPESWAQAESGQAWERQAALLAFGHHLLAGAVGASVPGQWVGAQQVEVGEAALGAQLALRLGGVEL